MAIKKRMKLEWIIISILLVIIITGSLFVIKSINKSNLQNNKQIDSIVEPMPTKESELLGKYEKLEQAYNSTLNEIETVINEDDINLSILKENLKQILETIKEDKKGLNLKADSSFNDQEKMQQFKDMLDMSKEVLAERLLEEKTKNEKLTIDNRKLHLNLKKSLNNFELEKINNVKLNDEIAQVKNQIKMVKDEGQLSANELKTLERQKDEIEKRLLESNKMIKNQHEQIQELGEIIRKVNIDCYFYYEKGNPEEEAVIYLTSQGISEKYVKYFVRKKPDIFVEFKIASDFFTTNVEKIELKLYNSLNVEIYSVSKVISSENIKIIIPNKNFTPEKYFIKLFAGDEDLLLDDKYSFKISN